MGANKPNIVFIVIDALRQENVSYYGYKRKTTPNIDRLAKEGVAFWNAYSSINATDPSLSSIFSGLYPRTVGLLSHGNKVKPTEVKYAKRVTYLPEILRDCGYRTIAVDFLARWHKKGYDIYKYPKMNLISRISLLRSPKMLLESFLGHRIEASEVTNLAIRLIKNNKHRPFFLFIHYWDVHSPYNPPSKYYRLYSRYPLDNVPEEDIENILKTIKNVKWREYLASFTLKKGKSKLKDVLDSYDGAIRFVDDNIGRIIDFLEDNKLINNTLIIITSDHGESLFEHSIYFDHHGLYEASIKVPLIMYYSKFENMDIYQLVQHVDVMPTLIDILGLDVPLSFDGYSLVPLLNGEKNTIRDYIYVEEVHTEKRKAIIVWPYKYITFNSTNDMICEYCGIRHGDPEELYDLRSDPTESINLISENRVVAEYLKNRLNKISRTLDEKRMKRVKTKKAIKNLKLKGKL